MTAECDLPLYRLNYFRVSVPQYRGPVPRYVANVLVSIYTPFPGALQPLHVDGKGIELPPIVRHPVREQALRPLGQCLGLRVSLYKLFLC